MAWACFSADVLPATLDIIVADTASGGAGGNSANGGVGTAGNYSEVHLSGTHENDSAGKVLLKAYGGGGG